MIEQLVLSAAHSSAYGFYFMSNLFLLHDVTRNFTHVLVELGGVCQVVAGLIQTRRQHSLLPWQLA